MKVLINGATAGTNFGDFLFARMFHNKIASLVGEENVFWYESRYTFSDFYRKHLGYSRNYRLKDIDALVFMSGGYMCGDDRNFRDYILRYLRYFHIGLKAIARRIPFGFFGLEIGKPRNFLLKKIEATLLQESDMTTVRNEESLMWCNSLIGNILPPPAGARLTADSVFALDRNLFDGLALPPDIGNCRNRRLFLHIEPNPARNRTLIEKVVPIIAEFISKHPGYAVVIGADQFSENQRSAYNEIKEALGIANVVFAPYDNPLLLCKILDNVDVIVTHKLHVGIVGARLGKSVISFSGHTEKIERLYSQLNESGRSCSLQTLTFEQGKKMLEKYFDKPIEVPGHIVAGAEQNFKELEKFINQVSKDLK